MCFVLLVGRTEHLVTAVALGAFCVTLLIYFLHVLVKVFISSTVKMNGNVKDQFAIARLSTFQLK